MIFKTLTREEQVKYGATHLFLINYADLVTLGGANLTYTWALIAGAIGLHVRDVKAKVKTAFVGCATLQVEVGDSGGVARNLAAFDLKSTAGTWKTLNPTTTTHDVKATALSVDALFTATTNNLSALTAGELLLLIDAVNLNNLPESK